MSDCTFDTSSNSVKIKYSFNNGVSSKARSSFFIGSFKNPVNPGTKSGFYVNSFDGDGNKIGESPVISLSGISTPNALKSVTFTLDTSVVA